MRSITLIFFPLTVFVLIDVLLYAQPQRVGVSIGSYTFSPLDFTSLTALTGAIIAIIVAAVLSGLGILGSGLNAVSVETILKAGFLGVLFAAFAPLAFTQLLGLGYFGSMLAVLLTLSYFAGVILSVRGGG